jgi:hypothetical protein
MFCEDFLLPFPGLLFGVSSFARASSPLVDLGLERGVVAHRGMHLRRRDVEVLGSFLDSARRPHALDNLPNVEPRTGERRPPAS